MEVPPVRKERLRRKRDLTEYVRYGARTENGSQSLNRLHLAAAALPRADRGFTRCRSFFQTTSFSAIVPILKGLANLPHCCNR